MSQKYRYILTGTRWLELLRLLCHNTFLFIHILKFGQATVVQDGLLFVPFDQGTFLLFSKIVGGHLLPSLWCWRGGGFLGPGCFPLNLQTGCWGLWGGLSDRGCRSRGGGTVRSGNWAFSSSDSWLLATTTTTSLSWGLSFSLSDGLVWSTGVSISTLLAGLFLRLGMLVKWQRLRSGGLLYGRLPQFAGGREGPRSLLFRSCLSYLTLTRSPTGLICRNVVAFMSASTRRGLE